MRILLVDDEPALLQLLSQYLVRAGHETVLADSVASALPLIESMLLDAAVLDLSLPDGSGEENAAAAAAAGIPRVIIASGHAYEPPKSLSGRVRVLQKPFLPRVLVALL